MATAIHAGHDLRGEVAALTALDGNTRRREEDPFTDLLIAMSPARVIVNRSRFEVDLNRSRDRAVYRTPEDAWGLDLWRGDRLPDDVAERSLALWDSFYAELAARLDPMAERGPFIVLDVHSYNHRRRGMDASPEPASENPEVNVGTGSLDRQRFAGVVDAFCRTMGSAGFDVRENVRFEGQNLARWVHDRYPGTGCVLALEFKKTFMDEWTGEPDAKHIAHIASTLMQCFDPMLERLPA